MAVVVLVSLLMAGCGSALTPEEVGAASGGSGAGGAVQNGEGSSQTGTVPIEGLPSTGVDETGTTPDGTGGGDSSGGSSGTGGTGAEDGGSGSGNGGGETPTKGNGDNAPTGGAAAASCDGFKNQTGVTDKKITVANVSDITGPIPGLFTAAQTGARAYVAYFNATSNICGRKLDLLALDSKEDAAADQQGYAKACGEAFAAIGSASAFDAGGAKTTSDCGLPDVRAAFLTATRGNCSTCFASQSAKVGVLSDAISKWYLKEHKAATQAAAFLYVNAGGSPALSKSYEDAAKRGGYKVVYSAGIEITEFNYVPFIQQMKNKGVKYVSFVATNAQSVRLAQTMQQQGFKPDVYSVTQAQYDNAYVQAGGTAVNGSYVALPHVPFDAAGNNKEIALFRAWLDQVSPGASPTTLGLFGWSAARLFVEKATALGGKLNRQSLLTSLRAEHAWTANGMHVAMDIGGKQTYKCGLVAQLQGTTWKQVTPGKFLCGNLVDVR